MKKTDLAYIAGLFDGEGSIGLNKTKNYNGTGSVYYRLLVQVCMVEEYIPQWLHLNFGGSLSKRIMVKPRRNITHWQIANRKAAEFLKVILPYLKIKKPQAEVALEFQSQRRISGGIKGKRGHPFKTEGEQAIEEVQFILMKNLKNREGTYVGHNV